MLTGELPLGKFQPPSKKVQMMFGWMKSSCTRWRRNRNGAISTPARSRPTWKRLRGRDRRLGSAPAPSQVVSEERAGWRGLAWAWGTLFSLMAATVVLGWFASDKSFSLLRMSRRRLCGGDGGHFVWRVVVVCLQRVSVPAAGPRHPVLMSPDRKRAHPPRGPGSGHRFARDGHP